MRDTQKISRRAFLKAGASMGGAAAAGMLGFALYEPHQLAVEQVEIRLARLPRALDGFRIAQLSDIHFADHMTADHLREIVARTNAQNADLVVITGDFVTVPIFEPAAERAKQAWPCAEELRRLQAPQGRVAVLGNHDHSTNPKEIAAALDSNGIQTLRNRALPIEAGGARLWLAGVDSASASIADVPATLDGVPADECVIAAIHEPDFADVMQRYPVDFQISGHSHGGQVRFPGVGPLYLPPLARKYPIGLRRVGAMQLYTNRGVGVIHVPVRFMCAPELTVFTLRVAGS